MRKFLFVFVFSLLCYGIPAHAASVPDLSGLGGVSGTQCQPYSATIPGQVSGTIGISGEVCTNILNPNTDMTGTGTVTFTHYAASQKFTADGSFNLTYTLSTPANPQSYTILYNGGPVNYTVGGTTYEVYYKDLSFTFAYVAGSKPQLSAFSGGVTINGQYVPVNESLYEYVQIF